MPQESPGQPAAQRPPITPIAVGEKEIAQALGLSVDWVRRDRRISRILPFSKIGGAVRYNLERVREAFLALEEGGAHLKPKKRGPRVAS